MAIIFQPTDLLKKIAPAVKASRLVTQELTVNRVALRSLARSGILSSKTLTEVALKVVKQYRSREKRELADGATKSEATELALSGKKLMVQRVQNAAVYEIQQEMQSQYRGELARWLPSSANIPDPLHQLNYGQVYVIGEGIDGEEPGDRFGCQCGVEILVDEDTLDL